MLITRTPYRFSLFGGGLDYPQWYSKKQVRVLCAGLDYYCYQTIRELPPFFDHDYRASYSQIETTSQLDHIKHPSIREVFKKFGKGRKLEVSHIGDLPAKSGIGSSSAFTVGLISSLCALNGKYLGRTELAKEAISIEQNEMGEDVGFQDQCAAAFGGLIVIDADKGGIKPRSFITSKEYIHFIESSLLMGFDGDHRFSSVATKKIKKAICRPENEKYLNELYDLSMKGIEAFGKEADLQENASITKACRDIKLMINGDSSNKNIMELIEETERAGSLCTRIMGAGGGGFFVCWAPKEKHENIKSQVNVKTWVEVKFSSSGCQIIFNES